MSTLPTPFDPEALLQHADWIGGLARRLVSDEGAAQELVQETWVSALRHRPRTDRSLRPWLAHVLRNFARQRARSDANRAARQRVVAKAERLPSAADLAADIETHRLLVNHVQALEEPFRETVVLRYFRGLSGADIARLRGLDPGTVRWRLKRALDTLRARLDAQQDGDRSKWHALVLPLATPPAGGEAAATSSSLGGAGASWASLFQGLLTMNMLTKVGVGGLALVALTLGALRWSEPDARALEPDAEHLARVELEPPRASISPAPSTAMRQPVTAPSASHAGPEAENEAPPGYVHPPPLQVHARALGPDGSPLAGARLRDLQFRDQASEPSSGDGELQLVREHFTLGVTTTFEVHAPGFTRERVLAEILAGGPLWLGDFHLTPAGEVTGHVLDEDGAPLEDAWIGAIVNPADEVAATSSLAFYPYDSLYFGLTERGPATSPGADGFFRLDGLPAGPVRIFARGRTTLAGTSAPIEIRAGEVRTGVELRLPSAANEHSISGIVLDPEGEPVPFANLRHESPTFSGGANVDSQGRFWIQVGAGTRNRLTVKDYEGRWAATSVDGVLAGTHGLELRFPPLRHVELVVRSADGKPVERFTAEVLDVDGRTQLSELPSGPWRDGRAPLVVPAQSFLVEVRAQGHDLARLGPLHPDRLGGELSCTVRPLPGLRGVVLAAGAPVAGARVALMRFVTTHTTHGGHVVRLWPHALESVQTDARGAFLLTPRELDTYAVLVESDGYALLESGPHRVEPAVGLGGLKLELGRGGSLEGSVRNATGQVVSGAIVSASRGDGRGRRLRTGPDGTFRFDGLTPGGWRVELLESEGGPGQATFYGHGPVEPIATNCEVFEGGATRFDLFQGAEQPYRLSGALLVDGRAATAWTAALTEVQQFQAAGDATVRFGPHGGFELGSDVGGRRRLVLLSELGELGHLMLLDVVELGLGDNAWSAKLELGALEGTLQVPAEPPGIPFYIWNGPGDLVALCPIAPDETGAFRCPDVPAGPGRIVLLGREQRDGFDPDKGLTLAEAVIAAGETTRLE